MTITWQKQLAIELLVISGIGLILGLLGPFGTYVMPFAIRLAYWVIFILVGYLIFDRSVSPHYGFIKPPAFPFGLLWQWLCWSPAYRSR